MNTKHALAFVIVVVGALAARAEETEVLFDGAGIRGWDTSRDADGKLDFPLSYLTIIAFGVQPGREYQLHVQRIEILRPDPPVATVHAIQVPERWVAGQTVLATVRFTLDKPCTEDDARLVLRRGRETLVDLPLPLPTPLSKVGPRQRVDLDRIPLRVPEYAWGGKAVVDLKLGEARVQFEPPRPEATVEQRPVGRTVAEVKRHGGVPTLFINGQPHSGMAWATYSPSVEVFGDFTRAGVGLFTFSGTPTEAGYGLSKTVWVAPGEFDYSEFDRRVGMLLEANPQAYFFPRLYLHAPAWWSAQHPDDLVLIDPGDGSPVPLVHAGGKPAPSWASEVWRRDTVEGLRRLFEHVAAAPYADRVVGYHLASGTTEEWMMWGGNENEWVDYSPANVRAFRRWLQAQYGTDQRLQAAWSDPAVTLATAAIPTKAQRQATYLGWLRDPAREQPVIDFYRYNSDLVADTIGYFAKAVKDLTRREKIVGVFYGYVLQLCGEQRQQNAGHLGLAQVLASPDVDFLSSPTSYAFRQLGGEGTSHFMSLLGSVQTHGKLWFDENDIRTSLSGGQVGEWGRPADVAGDRLQQDKELANCLVHGVAQWWFDVGGNRYNHPELMKRIGELTAKADQVLPRDRSPVDEVAFVVDERSLCYQRVGDPLGSWLLLGQLPALQRIGAPVGHYLVSDLPQIGHRRLYLFPTSFAPTAEDRRAVEAIKRDGHVLVFLGAPGLYRDGRLDERGMFDLTGIRLKMSREPAPLRVTLQPDAVSRLACGEAGLSVPAYGHDHRAFPIVYADDPEAKVLGTLADGRSGLVMKEHGTWTAVYSSSPLLPAPLLRRLAQRASVHLYVDTEDVVWASRGLLAVSVHRPGPRTIRLPRTADVNDLYEGSVVARGVDSFQADFPDRGTRVFLLQ
ncbi:MAG: hypothetical protein A2V98_00840 [Planctomycetes bacterium RBG_16_64_12]|nr:MAG: hypothetical protein A2V98_00840 [Planctomycetes bacterium RBG_16_64_12]